MVVGARVGMAHVDTHKYHLLSWNQKSLPRKLNNLSMQDGLG